MLLQGRQRCRAPAEHRHGRLADFLGSEDYLAVRVAAFKLGIGLADLFAGGRRSRLAARAVRRRSGRPVRQAPWRPARPHCPRRSSLRVWRRPRNRRSCRSGQWRRRAPLPGAWSGDAPAGTSCRYRNGRFHQPPRLSWTEGQPRAAAPSALSVSRLKVREKFALRPGTQELLPGLRREPSVFGLQCG
jgi:hypothetical protein